MFKPLPLLVALTVSVAIFGGPADNTPEALMEAGHWKRARAIVEPAYKANPNDAHLAHLLSRVKHAFDDDKSAQALAEKSVALDPKNADYHTHYAHIFGSELDDAPTIAKLALVKHLKQQLEAALALNPKQIDALLIKSVFLFEAPAFIGGDRKRADQVGDEMPRIEAEHGYLNVARLARQEKNYGKMEHAFRSALAANPRCYRAVYGLANLYCCHIPAPNWYAAEQKAREAIALDPSRIGGYSALAAVLANAQRWAELDALIAQSEKNVPDDLAPYYFAAKVLAETGADTPRAERYLQKYMSEEPEGEQPSVVLARWQLALVFEKQGRKPEAVKLMQGVVAALPVLDAPKKDLKRMKS